MASSSDDIKQLRKNIEEGKNKSINTDRKTIMIKIPIDEYDNLTDFIKLVNINTKEKVTKQGIVYKILLESGLLDGLDCNIE